MKQKNSSVSMPTLDEIQQERKRLRKSVYYRRALRGTVSVLVVVAAVAAPMLLILLLALMIKYRGKGRKPLLEQEDDL